MPHPIYGPPDHRLEVVTIRLHLPSRSTSWVGRAQATGESSTSKRSLWSDRLVVECLSTNDGLGLADYAHHLALVALQDRPVNQAQLDRALKGGDRWTEDELPF